MRFFFAVSAVFAAMFAFATAEPASPSQSSQAVADLQSYYSSIEEQNILVFAQYATDTAVLATITAMAASIQSVVIAGSTPTDQFWTQLPTPLASVMSSAYIGELSILNKDGFSVSMPTAAGSAGATTTKKSAAAGMYGMGGEGKLVGLMGMVIGLLGAVVIAL